jgi:hypothetical protein
VDAAAVQSFARQIALPEIGPEGQERLGRARVVVVGRDLAAEVAARYLEAAGVGATARVGAPDWPGPDGERWLSVLQGAAVVVRAGFEDDPMLRAAQRLGIPAVVVRADGDAVDLLSFANDTPAPDLPLAVATTPPGPAHDGAASVVAGALAAAEAIHGLLGRRPPAGARHLRVPLDGGPIASQEIPWGRT